MENESRKSWFGRNWLWVLPVGGCLTIILLFVFGLGAIFFGVSKALKNSTPYEYALQSAKANPQVVTILGDAIETDGLLQGDISLKNDRGSANLKIPIKGNNGKATIIVIAEKQGDDWTYDELYVLIKETQEEINLLDTVMEGD